jgi:hypothetical protein
MKEGKIEIKDLATYEMPTITEFISIGWLQNICASYLAWKVNKKIRRYNKRIERVKYLKEKGFIKS